MYCHCAYSRAVPAEVKQAVLKALVESGRTFDATADLCELAARKDPLLGRFAESPGLAVAACYPRAVRWLFAAAGTELPARSEVLNMKDRQAGEIIRALLGPEAKEDRT